MGSGCLLSYFSVDLVEDFSGALERNFLASGCLSFLSKSFFDLGCEDIFKSMLSGLSQVSIFSFSDQGLIRQLVSLQLLWVGVVRV